MTLARACLVPADAIGTYHCVSRCVRRAWLCGQDALTGIDYSHRKSWVEQRLALLAEVFAVGVYGYAVMSNHLHVVVRMDPAAVATWTDIEVAARWCRLHPPRDGSEAAWQLKCETLLLQPERLTVLRQRLASLSWFMRCLNEPLARAANREDGCKGRFWEGRFKCQRLLDECAVLSAMAYVDLNPIRAGMTRRLDHSRHTSIQRRVRAVRAEAKQASAAVQPVLGLGPGLSLNQGDYIELVEWTGRQLRPGKRGAIPANAPRALAKTGITARHWPTQVKAMGSGYWRIVGSAQQLLDHAEHAGQRWFKGIGTARRWSVA